MTPNPRSPTGSTPTLPAVVLPGATPARPRVLVVDDEEMVRCTMSRCLERLGFAVTTAASGAEALETLGVASFDAILTDHHMPRMTGGELVRQALQRDPSLHGRFVVASGALHDDATRQLVATTGCRAIRKPFELAELARIVRAAVQGVRSER